MAPGLLAADDPAAGLRHRRLAPTGTCRGPGPPGGPGGSAAPAGSAGSAGARVVGGALARFRILLGRPPLLAAYACALAPLLTFVAMYTALTGAVGDRYQITGAGPLLLIRLAALPGIAVGAGAGWVINRVGPYRAGAGAFLISAVGMVIEATAGPLWLLLAGSAVYVGGLAVAIPSAISAVALASGQMRGTGIAGYTFLIGLGGAAAPILVTATAPAGFGALALILAAVLAAASLIIGLGPRWRTGTEPAPQSNTDVEHSDAGHADTVPARS